MGCEHLNPELLDWDREVISNWSPYREQMGSAPEQIGIPEELMKILVLDEITL
jgi:hypothetical protein